MKWILRILGGLLSITLLLVLGAVIHANHRIRTDEVLTPEAANPPGRILTVRSHRLHVVTVGDIASDPTGVPLLLVHGFSVAGSATLLPWAREKLAPQRALILPDLVGFGYSQRLVRIGEYYTVHSNATDLLLLLNQLGVNKVDIVGQGLGATVAARFAFDYPQAVRKLVLMNPVMLAERTTIENAGLLPLGIGRALTWHALGSGPFGDIATFCRGAPTCTWMPPAHIRGTTAAQGAMLFMYRRSPENEEVLRRMGWLKNRALVILGADDRIVPIEQGRQLARIIQGPLVLIPNAGHMPYQQKPDDVAAQVLEYLDPGE